MFLKGIILLHILSATIWTGGHIILSLGYLPAAIKNNDFDIIISFESRYERIGMPALLVLVITGVYMTTVYSPEFFQFDTRDHYTRHIMMKFGLLLVTIGLAIHARFFLIPKKKLKLLAIHIVGVTIASILFVLVGFSARSGGLL